MPPHPGGPRRNSNASIWIIVGVLVVALIATVALFAVRKSSTSSSGGTDLDKMRNAFPGLVQPDGPTELGSSGAGYDGHRCGYKYAPTGATLEAPRNGSLNLGPWVTAWDCYGVTGKPTYAVLAYRDQSDVSRVVEGLPPNTKGFAAEYNSYRWQTPDSASPVQYWKVEAFRSAERSRYLIVAQDTFVPKSTSQNRDIHAFDRWCVAMPL
ncbi:hypothetical protein [Nocardia sp. NPDC051832]|uniref:hypothetical protein n=1 Tax=Nocardia sp. NPDC051832 TaxID=3155673 RepID=UPI00342DEADB